VTIQLLSFDGCPHEHLAETRLRQALDLLDVPERIERLIVEGQTDAERLGSAGSPSILVDGRDLFDSPEASVGLACRVSLTLPGRRALPPWIRWSVR